MSSGVEGEDRGGRPFPIRYTLPLLLGSTLNPINSSLIATGLASIAADFHRGPGETATLVSVLYLCSAVAQPTMGKLATIFGPRRVFLAGIVILLAGGVLGALAPSLGVLLVSRGLIGVGTSAAFPTAMALVRRRADALGVGVPARVIGGFSIAAQITIVFGLPIGGVLTSLFGWRSLFAVNIPVALVVFAFAWWGIDRDGPRDVRGVRPVLRAVDLPGIALFAGATVGILLFLGDLRHPSWWALAAAVVHCTALILWERRAASPLIDVRMLAATPALPRTYLRQLLIGLGTYTALYGASQWLEEGAGYTPAVVGLILLPLSGASIVLARLNSVKGWVRWPLVVGAVALVGTGVMMTVLGSGSGVALFVAMTLLFGVTNGLSGFANQAALYVQSPAEQIATASGLYRTFNYLGAIFSSSVIAIAFGDRVTDAGFHALGWVVVGIGAASVVLTALDRRIPAVTGRADAPEGDGTGP